MKQFTKAFLSLLALTIMVIPDSSAARKLSKDDDSKEIPALQISYPGLKLLTVPIIAQRKSVFLPLAGAKVPAVKVAPWIEGHSIRFEVLAVLDQLPGVRSCDSMKQLRTELITAYTANPGETIKVSAVDKFGTAPFSVNVTKVNTALLDCPPSCCCCGPTMCCPRKGCLDCGDCGFCCNQ